MTPSINRPTDTTDGATPNAPGIPSVTRVPHRATPNFLVPPLSKIHVCNPPGSTPLTWVSSDPTALAAKNDYEGALWQCTCLKYWVAVENVSNPDCIEWQNWSDELARNYARSRGIII